jgi:Spy/CpxP family protein refolding chaperone
MKFILIRVILTLAVVLPAYSTRAATSANYAAVDRASAFRDRIETLAKELQLTDEQKEKLRPIFQAEVERLKNLRADTSLSRRAKLRELKKIRAEATPKVKEILTPEQFQKWKSIQADARDEFRAARRRARGRSRF